jgi:carboxypeptidase PM20D1
MTQLSGSDADNVLPSEARAVLNLRLLPGWTIEDAVQRVRKIVRDPRVEVTVNPDRGANNPVPAPRTVALGEGPGWKEVTHAVSSAFPEAASVPYLVTATTDSRHYADLCDAVYRFAPVELDGAGIGLIHNHDERISVENYVTGIVFYNALIGAMGKGV